MAFVLMIGNMLQIWTANHTHKIIDGCLFGYNEKPSFGEVVIDFSKDDPTATYRAFSIDDEEVGEVEVKLSALRLN